MNQSSSSKERSLLASATKDELIVAQILLDLRILLSLSESLANSNWTRRRRRSCYDTALPLLPEPSPATVRTDNEIEERRPRIETDEVKTEAGKCGAAARSTPSPDTPLSFSPSETDEKSKHSSRKNSRKRVLLYFNFFLFFLLALFCSVFTQTRAMQKLFLPFTQLKKKTLVWIEICFFILDLSHFHVLAVNFFLFMIAKIFYSLIIDLQQSREDYIATIDGLTHHRNTLLGVSL